MSHFRADSIVLDAERIRGELGVDAWSIIGQSFGGFCVLAYLSRAPDGLREAFFLGGLPPVGEHTDEVYARYYERYPADGSACARFTPGSRRARSSSRPGMR